MPDQTKIIFSGGAEVIVDAEPSEVMDALNRQEPFHHLKSSDGGSDVYLSGKDVAYLEQYVVPEPMFARGG